MSRIRFKLDNNRRDIGLVKGRATARIRNGTGKAKE